MSRDFSSPTQRLGSGSPASIAASSPSGVHRRPSTLSLAVAAQAGVVSNSSPKISSQAERFKRDEAAFLSSSSKSPQQLQQSAVKPSPKAKRDRDRQEELERFLDSMQPLSAKSGMGNSLVGDESSPTAAGGLRSVDEKSSSGSFAPLSPRASQAGNGSPNAGALPSSRAHAHARRPSFMQPTEQELARQAELREANQARERKQEEERARAARRAQGVTSTDLYLKQQQELEAKRLAGLEKEQAERAAERARFLAKYEADHLQPGPATERTARPRPQQLPSPNAAASGSQTSRAAASSAATAASSSSSSSSSSALQAELQRREEILRRDAQQGFHQHATTDDTDSSDDDDASSDGDTAARGNTRGGGAGSDDEDDDADTALPAAHGRRKGKTAADLAARKAQGQKMSRRQQARGASISSTNATPLPPGVAQSRLAMLAQHSAAGAAASSAGTAASPAAAASSARTHRAAAPSSSSVTAATAAALAAIGIGSSDDEDDSAGSGSDAASAGADEAQRRAPASSGLPFAAPALSSSADIYDPALARRAAAVGLPVDSSLAAAIAADSTGAALVTGMDLLIRSKKFRKAKAEAERKGRTDAADGSGGAAVNSSFGRLTAAQLERQMDQLSRKKALESKAAAEGGRSNHAHAVEQAQAAQQAKKAFLPNMFRSRAS